MKKSFKKKYKFRNTFFSPTFMQIGVYPHAINDAQFLNKLKKKNGEKSKRS